MCISEVWFDFEESCGLRWTLDWAINFFGSERDQPEQTWCRIDNKSVDALGLTRCQLHVNSSCVELIQSQMNSYKVVGDMVRGLTCPLI